jgi:hypothetical protein
MIETIIAGWRDKARDMRQRGKDATDSLGALTLYSRAAQLEEDADALALVGDELTPLAAEWIREHDAHNYPHDEPCPRCGRRQWTDEHAQETCQACGTNFAGTGALS